MEGVSGRLLKSAQTDSKGEFGFADIAPGLYFLHLNPSRQMDGLLAVTVDPAAPADSLDLELFWSSCGLEYADRNKCSKSELQVEQLCGKVMDTGGTVIPRADILVYDSSDPPKPIERMQSDSTGGFAASKSLVGTYQLVIANRGFNALRTTVHLQPSGDLTCRQPLQVHLGLFGICSAADAR